MTDKEIIKALNEVDGLEHICLNCMYNKGKSTTVKVIDVDDFINRQQAEINRLKYQVNRLKNYDERRDIDLHSRLIANARAEAIKEFVNSATDLCYKEFENNLEVAHTFAAILTRTVDNFEKEMVGEQG